MKEVRLKNGTKQPISAVTAIMIVIRNLMDAEPMAFYELVLLCRDANHELWGATGEILRNRNLITAESKVHETIHSVVLSAVVGDGIIDMHIESPIA